MPVGACYISKNNEVGLFISIDEQGKGYGTAALREMLSLTKGIKLYANINPANDRSRRLFEGNGFRLIQQTFALENPMLGQSRNTDTHPDP
jgi:RimJ/RimL family protein N-acetyltransferase